MKSLVFVTLLGVLLVASCTKGGMFNERTVGYSVTNGSGSHIGGTVAHVSYINENGENEFAEVQPGMTWGWSGDFEPGDWVRVQAECSGKKGSIRVSVKCDDGDNEKVTETIDLSVRNIVEASMTLN